MFGDGGRQVVIGNFACDATERRKRMHVTTDKSFETLTVGELHTAVRFHQGESIEFALIPGVFEYTEVPQSTSNRSPGGGSIRRKARLDLNCGWAVCTYPRRMVCPPR